VSTDCIDVGLAQLAMHSANEVVGADDTFYLYKAFKKFYDIKIKYDINDIIIK
jgi:aspartyl aminopeptidase